MAVLATHTNIKVYLISLKKYTKQKFLSLSFVIRHEKGKLQESFVLFGQVVCLADIPNVNEPN